ncbi:hypothetical protein Zmor_019441 [Zophobas morio]|uniref:Uncharacterized protein n=1 Tax=Zophobas morio TaxID=2755281 RepID=A0AA38M8H6_9CUCU|nr:hypothetical protein Zmor_019441 [Zophobas morio]
MSKVGYVLWAKTWCVFYEVLSLGCAGRKRVDVAGAKTKTRFLPVLEKTAVLEVSQIYPHHVRSGQQSHLIRIMEAAQGRRTCWGSRGRK